MFRWWIVLLLACLPAAGCASQGTRGNAQMAEGDSWRQWDDSGEYRIRTVAGNYAANRFYDFMDIFDASLSFGPVARLEAQYLIGFWGFGATDCTRLRLGGRSWVLEEKSTTVSTLPFPASLVLFPSYFITDDVNGTIITFGGISHEEEYAKFPDPLWAGIPTLRQRIKIAAVERDPKAHRFHVTGDSMAVGLDAHLLIGGRLRVMPLQVFDFVAGIFGWNLVGDDIVPYNPSKG